IILKRNINQLTVNAGYSGYYDPLFNTVNSNAKGEYPHAGKIDGNEVNFDANYGVALGKKGFINFTLDYDGILGYTFRQAKVDPTANMKNSLPLNIYRRGNGDGTANMLNSFFNAEAPIEGTKTTFYAFGGYSYKGSDDYAFSRQSDNPNKFPNQTSAANSPIVTNYPGIIHGTPEGLFYYNPIIQTHNFDFTGTAGFKGSWKNNWDWDASNTTGNNVFHFYGDKTFNVGLVPNSAGVMQTHYDDGGSQFFQNTTNLNVNKHYPNTFAGMNLALGSEFRFERYSIYAGEPNSYLDYNYPKSLGSQGFPGFRPTDAAIPNPNRSVYGAYADLETDFTTAFLLDAAARYEHYNDFGSTLNGKLAARYKVSESFNLRGSASTGFRAPSLAQINFSDVYSNVTSSGYTLVKIFPNYDPLSRAAGIPPLKQEKSQNYSLGFAWKPVNELSVTVDGYLVKIKDRVVLTGQLDTTAAVLAPTLKSLHIDFAQFFANAVNTTNRGLDVVVDYNHTFGKNRLKFTLTGNLQHMSIDNINYPPAFASSYTLQQKFYSDRERKFLLASAPDAKFAFNAEYGYDRFSVGTRLTYFGKITLDGYGDDTFGFNDTATGSNANPEPQSTNDAGTGTVPNVYVYSAKVVTDLYFGYKINKNAKISLGVDNIFNVHPDLSVNRGAVGNSSYNNEGGGPFDAVQMGENGRRGYVKVGFTF
ncbi:MAG: TonB-dependent receptor, partial [Mucilaginibacter sp.]|nr:TonB-dependent receptor [Mucilaginibacter sp.]